MDHNELISLLKSKYALTPVSVELLNGNEVYIKSIESSFGNTCFALHKELNSPVMSLFARELPGSIRIYCVFLGKQYKKWFIVELDTDKASPKLTSIAKKIFSANGFEREMKEMFGIDVQGNPDSRRLRLHDEVWPEGYYPLRKDFKPPLDIQALDEYKFVRVQGEGVYEIPVGPVHAGIIGPGHFRFSVAGEPIINLEIRLGYTHRGVEKLMEGLSIDDALILSECVAGDSAVAHGWAFISAIEKIFGISVPNDALRTRAVLLELERIYSHIGDLGGMALDVAFTHPASFASIIKEGIHRLNDKISASRYLKGVIKLGGVSHIIGKEDKESIKKVLSGVTKDIGDLKETLLSSVSFQDRIDTTGHLNKKVAEDLGVLGLVGRSSGLDTDLRRDMPSIYGEVGLKVILGRSGDVLARTTVRFDELEESIRIINLMLDKISDNGQASVNSNIKEGFGIGCVEGWRGPVLYWLSVNSNGKIERCKITDPSFRNWNGLSSCVTNDIVPDFPVCNKSFDLSYSGNDL